MQTNKKLILVVGGYKTGTSLTTYNVMCNGYYNPAMDEKRVETGIGLTIERYNTYESSTIREINRKLLYRFNSGFGHVNYTAQNRIDKHRCLEISSYLSSLTENTVIKDPLLCWTLPVWIKAAIAEQLDLKVILTLRKQRLFEAWNHALFTKELLKSNSSLPYLMQERVLKLCNSLVKDDIQFGICQHDMQQIL